MYYQTIKKISLFLIIFFSLTAGNVYGEPLPSKEIFKSAHNAYRAYKNKEALRFFLTFRKEFPEDKKADDAIFYIGKIYKRMGKIDMAIKSFNEIISLTEKSNRFREASFYLARIYYRRSSYEQAVLLLKPFRKLKDFNRHDFRLLRLLARARYKRGKENNKQNKKEDARKNFLESVKIYALLADNYIKEEDRINDLIGMAKSLFYLESLARENKDDISAQLYKESAQKTLKHALALNKDEKRERYLEEKLKKISADNNTASIKKSLLKIRLEFLGKTNSKAGGTGSDISVRGSYKSSTENGRQYRLSGSFRHDDFAFKTCNFNDIEIDEKSRLIQKTDRFSAKFEKLKGFDSSLNSRLILKTIYLLAEDHWESYKRINILRKNRI